MNCHACHALPYSGLLAVLAKEHHPAHTTNATPSQGLPPHASGSW